MGRKRIILTSLCSPSLVRVEQKPTILFSITDDASFDLGAYGGVS